MSAVSPQRSSVCPWGNLTSTTTTTSPLQATAKSPKLQEILDEELARQMQEIDLHKATQSMLTEDSAVDALVIDDSIESDEIECTETQVEVEHEDDTAADDVDDYDEYDAYDEADDAFLAKNHRARGMGARGRRGGGADGSSASLHHKLQLSGTFDDRTRFVLGKLAGRGILSAVDSRIHGSLKATIHHGKNEVVVATADGYDESVVVHYAVKVLKFGSSADHHRATKTASEALQRSGRPVNEEMLWMSIRRQLKIQMDREHAALARAVACGVRCPAPVCRWEHVLVSAFVGDGATAAPRLRDVILRPGQHAQAFVDLLVAMRAMYQQAKLVHGGLSEFSILYHNDACWITDFSSAVDTTHEEHVEALALDVASIHGFFQSSGMPAASKHSVGVLHVATMHELITQEAPSKVLSAFPWLKPYLYSKKE